MEIGRFQILFREKPKISKKKLYLQGRESKSIESFYFSDFSGLKTEISHSEGIFAAT